MILITGANGNLGSLTIDNLLELNPSAKIAGLVRSEEKGAALKEKGVKLRIGDYHDYKSMEDAMEGVDTLMLISSSSLQARFEQHKNAINAAKEAGVKHILYTSIVQADKLLGPLSKDHNETEKLLKGSGLPYTIYRNTFYGEFIPLFLGNALETGEWVMPSGGKKINLALRTEMAEALAVGLQNPSEHKNKIYEITSQKAYTLTEIADILSKASGKEITYTDISVSEFENALEEIGLPEEQIAGSVMTAETFAGGALDFTYPDLEQLLGRKPADIEDFIQEVMNN